MKAWGGILKLFGLLALTAGVGMAVLLLQVRQRGIDARAEPGFAEEWIARRLRSWATPAERRAARNPLVLSDDLLARARAHFADHCASCHGNDGRGQTRLGQALYPKAPDMTLAETQSLSDGELFSIIENGIRLSGMPAWGQPGGQDDGDTWELVLFIRNLTALTPEQLAEMEQLNPRSRHELEQEADISEFLAGGEERPAPPTGHHDH